MNDLTQAKKLVKKCLDTQNPYLDLGNCGITDLKELPELFECTHLETLIFSNVWSDGKKSKESSNIGMDNMIISITKEISNFKKLKNLIIAGGRKYDTYFQTKWNITDISFLSNLTSLQSLDLSYNQIPDISFLSNLTGLQTLKLRNNQISDISFLSNLTRLQTLYLCDNEISDFSSLSNLTGLKDLSLFYNKISDISFLSNLKELKSLNLSTNKISDISFLSNLTGLQELDLCSNQISDITVLGKLDKLQTLSLNGNQIFNIRFLGNLIGLQYLNLGYNQISDFSSLSYLTGLQDLYLFFNQISDISFLSNLTGLKTLDLHDNQISDISFLTNLTGLQEFYLWNNQISDISFLSNLTGLQYLDLKNNQLKEIPPSIFQLNMEINMEEYGGSGKLCLYGNPIESPPLEILKQGKQSVLDWFAAKEKGELENLNEIKIILIGDSETGKTSLLRRLKDGSFDKNEGQTDGINIIDINFGESAEFENQKLFHKEINGENKYFHEITGHFWDFGGQEIMSATHSLFLTKRTIYVLVLDARNDENITGQIRKWLKRIVTTGGNSPIIVLANKIDINPNFAFLNKEDLEKEFPQVKDRFIKISCETKENLAVFKNTLADVILTSEMLNTPIDVIWIKIKEKLQKETKSKKYLDQSRFRQICKEAKLTDDEKQKNAIDFFNQLGLVLHFEKLRLTNFFVLDPYWITYGAYRILTSKIVADSHGKVCMKMLNDIINKEEKKTKPYNSENQEKIEYLDNEMEYLIDILHEFKLCIRVGDDHFIIPNLLNGDPPQHIIDTIKSDNKSIQFVYEYEYLPDFVLPHIMVEMHKNTDCIWRTGCVLHDNESKGLITKYDNKISIIVIGDNEMWKFMSYIRHEIDLINKDLPQPNRLIPLPGLEGVFADYDELLIRIQNGNTEYTTVYNKTLHSFSIEKLLYGILGDDVKKLIQKTYDSVTRVESKTEKIIYGLEEMNKKLDSHFIDLMKSLNNTVTEESIQKAIKEISAQQTEEITGAIMNWITYTFTEFESVIDEKFANIFNDLKKAKDLQAKLRLSVPFINMLGINLGIEFDIKSWASRMYKKYELEIFKLMGYIK